MRYLLLAAAATALFFAAYWVLMRHEKRHQMVRWYLMGTLVLSLLLPAIHLRLAVPQQHIAGNLPGIFSQASLPGMASTASTASTAATADTGSVSFAQVFLWVWLTGFAVAATLLAVRVLRLRRRMRALPCREEDGIRLTLLDDDTPAFSFGKHIVVGTKGFSDAEVQQLVGHETIHVRQGHTVDTLLCELAKAVLWFDPFVYLYARELKRVHEYIADSAMMSASYAELFYHQVSGRSYSPLANGFDYRMVHQRIAMMARHRGRSGWLKPLAALPVAVAVLLAACSPKSSPLVGHWEYVSGTSEHVFLGDNVPYPGFTVDMGEEHLLDDLTFNADGTASFLAWNNTMEDHKFVYEPCALEWQVVGDSLLLRNERGEEVWHILQLDDETLVFVDSDIFTYHGGDGHQRNTYTYRRKK